MRKELIKIAINKSVKDVISVLLFTFRFSLITY